MVAHVQEAALDGFAENFLLALGVTAPEDSDFCDKAHEGWDADDAAFDEAEDRRNER